MTTLRLIKSIGRSPLRLALLLIPLVFACFALSPDSASGCPPPDGGYPGVNTAEGDNALFSLTSGACNTAVGFVFAQKQHRGQLQHGDRRGTLLFNTADRNTAIGAAALFSNTTGSFNTATGFLALTNNTVGDGNTANGTNALAFNITGSDNTATGNGALFNNNASGNTANGANALLANTTGFDDTAMGKGALGTNSSGSLNTAIGYSCAQLQQHRR